jgi:dienelactone hydrolase
MIAALALLVLPQGPIAEGSSKIDLTVNGTSLEVFCYKPKSYRGERMVMVLHGTLRDADAYRDDSRKMAERFGALIVAPKFDETRFPSRRYHRGGILREDGTAAPQSEWTYPFIPEIAQQIRRREGKPSLPYTLLGHSAGGQFLVRLAGFYNPGAVRIVAANPGSDLFPTRDMPFGYGFGNLPPELSNDDVIRAYLAQPLTLYLGGADNGWDEYLDDSPEAMAQGPGRRQRGQAVFAAAQKLAKERGWPFHWQLVIAPGVNHDHQRMFEHPQADVALFGKKLW